MRPPRPTPYRRRAQNRAELVLEPLEDRSHPSAGTFDALPLSVVPLGPVALGQPAAVERPAPTATAAPTVRRELVLIDRDVPDRAALARNLLAARVPGTAVAVVELSGGGVAEATAVLARYRDLDAVHLISHGGAGVLHLGTDRISGASLGAFAGAFRTWGAALNPGADVLLYGCDLAGGDAGRALAARIAALTGAEVAASADRTGAAPLGGDWDLEYRTGEVETAVRADGTWAHALALPSGIVLATAGDVSNGGTPGVQSWTAGTVLNVADPNFSLEPGVTGGTFSALVNLNRFTALDVTIDALYFVRHALSVGTGAATVALLPGDLLLSVSKDGATLTSQNALTVRDDEVFVYRPSAGGDYSAGTFFLLLDNFETITGGSDTSAIGLVEADTVVGDVTLRAGSFLFTRSGVTSENDIRLFVPTGVGVGTTAGAVSVLIEGDNLGISQKVHGVGVVEASTTLGGRALAAGTLLVGIQGSNSGIGRTNIAATKYDIIALDVTRTTLGSGTAVADASLIFQGADLGLNSGPEAIRAFSLASVDAPPVATDDSYATNEDAPLVVGAGAGVLSNDSDPGGDTLTAVVASGPSRGTVALASNGSFVYTPAANDFGPDAFTYTVSNGRGGTATGTVSISVRAVNDTPSFALAGNPPAVDEGSGARALVGFATGASSGPGNEGGQGLTFVVTGNTNPALFSDGPSIAPNGTLAYTPAPDASGTATVTVVLRDDGGTANGGQDTSAARTFTITVRPVNDAPTLGPIGDAAVAEDGGPTAVPLGGIGAGGGEAQALSVTATSSDPALVPNPTVTYASPNATGALTLAPAPDASGTVTVTVTVRDAGLNGFLGDTDDATTTRTFTVTVAPTPDAPTADPDTYSTVGLPLLIPGPGVLANDTDADGDALTAAVVGGPANGILVLLPDGSFTYTPALGFSGVDAFTYRAVDSTGRSSAPTTVTINVALGNRAPAAANDAFATNEDTPLAGDVLANDSDPDGDALTAALVSGPANGAFTFNADGTFAYAPNPNYNGPDAFTYTAGDGSGGTATATVFLSVLSVNDAPTAADDSASLSEDGSVVADVRANDADAENDALTVVAVTRPANGTATTNGATVTYTPDPDFTGSDAFTYTISDGSGGTATATVTVTVTAVNDAPTLGPIGDAAVAEDGGPTAVPLGGIGAGGGEAQALSVTATSSDPALVPNPTVTYASPNATGALTLAPAPDASGTAVITVTVSDGTAVTSRSFTITVTAVNDAPTVTPVADQTVPEDGTVGPIAFVAGDAETAPGSLAVTATSSNPALVPNGAVTLTPTGGGGYQIALVPVADNSGAAVVTLTVSDGTATATATFTVTVTAANDAPSASHDEYTTTRGTRLAVAPSGALDNDTDVDGDVLAAALVAGPRHGTLQLNPDGSFVYDPDPGFEGTDSFTYRTVDPSGAPSGVGTVTLRVVAPVPVPVPTPDPPGPTPGAPDEREVGDRPPPGPDGERGAPRLAPRADEAGREGFPDVVSGANTGIDPAPAAGSSVPAPGPEASPVVFLSSGPDAEPEPVPQGAGKELRGHVPESEPKAAPADGPGPAPPRVPPVAPPATPNPPASVAPPPAPSPHAPDPEAATAADAGLDKVSRDVAADADARALTDAVVTTAVAATAGYVLLNTRAVYWLISALLARPAVWRRFDPIDVIYSWEREQELGTEQTPVPGDGESLQSMVG